VLLTRDSHILVLYHKPHSSPSLPIEIQIYLTPQDKEQGLDIHMYIYIYIYIHICTCVCVCDSSDHSKSAADPGHEAHLRAAHQGGVADKIWVHLEEAGREHGETLGKRLRLLVLV